MSSWLELLVRRRQVARLVVLAQPSTVRGSWLVHAAQARAMVARDAFVRQRGSRAMPDPDGGATDRELIAALDNYRSTRELVELPGGEVFGLWRQCAEDRRHILSWANTLAAVFSREARALFVKMLRVFAEEVAADPIVPCYETDDED